MSNSKESLTQQPALSPARRAILEKWKRGKAVEISGAQRISRRVGQGPVPLSFAQQRLWFLDQLEPGNPFYNMHIVFRLSGHLAVEALERSLGELVRRHEALHTTFATVEGQPVQVITPVAACQEFALFMVDLRGLSEEEREAQAQRLAQQEAEYPFDLSRDQLLRIRLLRLDDEEHLLLLCIHHIVSDGWSNGVFLQELSSLYNAFVQGKPSPLPELPIQYADFACWQRQWLQGKVLEAQVHYWKEQLRGVAPLELPTDHPHPAVQTFRGATQGVLLPAALSEDLKQLSQREGVTLFMTLLASFQVLLARYTGQTDITVGTPIANRTRAEVEGLIGFFVNTLVLRSDLSGNPSFQQLLVRVRDVALGAYAHQDVPFEKLVEVLQPERDLSRSPLFQVMFILQNTLPMQYRLRGVTLEQLEEESTTARFDLTLVITDSEQGLHCMLEYNTDLFETSTMHRLLGHWQTLLAGIVAQPEQSLATLPFLTPGEQHQHLHTWNDTARDLPNELCLPQLVEAQVMRTPEAIALSCGDEQVTYTQLNERANTLARYLMAQGVEPERLVAVLAERSIAFATTMLAIWKAGGVYLPLDPQHPSARIAQVLTRSRCVLVLVTDDLRPTLLQALEAVSPTMHPAVVSLEALLAQAPSTTNSPARCHPQQLAYVLYTSGSTGAPKGVMVEHRGMRNHLAAKSADVQLSQADHIAQNGPQCFDISVWQCFAALLIGGRVHIFPDELALDPPRLLTEVEQQQVTILQLVPSLLRELIYAIEARGAGQPALSALRWLVPTGDALPAELCRHWLRLYPKIPVLNTYGSTECSDDQCHYAITSLEGEDWPAIMPIGTPIANLRAYVLDAWLELVPLGVVGELYIGGIGVGRGYLDDPERTAAIFVPDPFGEQAGGRLYKTRDLVRYRADGTLEFMGRVDHLVKVRGHRIELGEIEAVLEQHPGVRESVVVVHEGGSSGGKQLVAYVVPGQQSMPFDDLRSYLRGKLPNYMQPACFMILEALPLNSNGKVDRQALPVPETNSVEGSKEVAAARTPLEEVIAGIWGEVLGRKQVSIHDNFFACGGHSLLATQLISRIRAVLQVKIPLRSLFETPTIAGLAQRIERLGGSEREIEIPPPVPISREQDVPLSFAQQRLWFLDQLVPGSSFYNTPRSVYLKGQLHMLALEQSLNEITRRQEALRTIFVAKEDQAVQVILPPRSLILPVVNLEDLPASVRQLQAQQLIAEEARQPFDLAQEPPMRMTLLRLEKGEHLLLLTMHHIVSDDWSTNVFFRELGVLYQAKITGKPSPLPELPLQYADFAVWQRQWLKGEVLQSQLSYWRHKLAGASTFLELSRDHARPVVESFRGARHKFALSKTLSEALKALSRREGVTLFMTLLAAFKVLLYSYAREDDILVGSPIANRVRVETEGLIGCFFNTLVLRTSLAGNPSFQELVGRVRETALGAYAHQDLPFEELVRDLKLERHLSWNPLFQVMFSLHNAPTPPLELPNLSLQPLEVPVETVRLDLTLHMMDTHRGLLGMVDYNTDLFEVSTIERIVGHLEILLHTIVTRDDVRLNALTEILSELDRQQAIIKEKEHKEATLQKLRSTKRRGVSKAELIGENT
jgi:amino acid adenylation domain-containing protein